jgi:hypothetical protein
MFPLRLLYQQGNKSAFNSVKFSIKEKKWTQERQSKRTENDDNPIDEVIPSNGVTNTLACASE